MSLASCLKFGDKSTIHSEVDRLADPTVFAEACGGVYHRLIASLCVRGRNGNKEV
jgi:hypothetical protein